MRLTLGDKVSVKAYGLSATITGAVRTRMQPREERNAAPGNSR